jgi:hypothetical protein
LEKDAASFFIVEEQAEHSSDTEIGAAVEGFLNQPMGIKRQLKRRIYFDFLP